jgi:hypothetical protein
VAASDDPESVRFVDAVRGFYVERYGGADATPVDPAEVRPPCGVFLLGSLSGAGPVCCGTGAVTTRPRSTRATMPGATPRNGVRAGGR